MKATSAKTLSHVMNPLWLTGPLFDKELRVSSRRRRNYALRFIYVMLLTFFVAIAWLGVVESEYAPAFQKSRMGVAGKTIITTIVTFQFIVTQLLAVVMLSTSISDEIHHRTLGLLMTTPINSLQVVMGKLFSKLLQILLLLAISLPLLAVVRVFGGVPAGYLVSSFCITLTAVIFAGAVSLFFSINNRRAYVVIIKTVFILGSLFAFLPVGLGAVFGSQFIGGPMASNTSVWSDLLSVYANPFVAMPINTARMISPAARGTVGTFYWPVHCALMLAAASLVLAVSVKIVRKVALRQATGQLDLLPKRRTRRKRKVKAKRQSARSVERFGIVRRVKGSPVLWKETRAPMIRGVDNRNSYIGLAITIIALFATYGMCKKANCLHEGFVHVTYVLMFVIIGSIFTLVLSATSITSERESRAWPIMLATSMDDWHILLGKAGGIFRRCLPIWLLLAGHVLLFVCVRYIHPIAVVHLLVFVAGLVAFLTGTGIYFSSRFKRTTSSVVASFALAIALWAVLPSVLGLMSEFLSSRRFREATEVYISANPLVQSYVVTSAAGGHFEARTELSKLRYQWPHDRDPRWEKLGAATLALSVYALCYALMGTFFAWLAKRRFRRKVF